MLLNKRKDAGAKDVAVDLPVDGIIAMLVKNLPFFHLDCNRWFIARFDVQQLGVISFEFRKLQRFWKLLEKIFSMALVPFLYLLQW